MNSVPLITGPPDEQEAINIALATMLRMEPAELSIGAEASLADDVVLCGILGGKDVGKSTLINALARTTVSVDTDEVGRGTDRPMAYIHRDARPAVERRLQAIGLSEPIDLTVHDADEIRNVALVDLPDFDSEFQEHLAVVRRVAPLMDRVIWVLTPRKLGDRAWVRLFRDVIKDTHNVYCVLNKVDELLSDADPFLATSERGGRGDSDRRNADEFWEQQDQWLSSGVRVAGYDAAPAHRFMLAAAFPEPEVFVRRIAHLWDDPQWSRYRNDQDSVVRISRMAGAEVERLRACVLAPLSADEAVTIKQANRECERRANVARLREHYRLEELREQLSFVCDEAYSADVFDEAFPAEWRGAVADRLRGRLRTDRQLADEVLESRVDDWPLLRLVHWPFGWLSRSVGGRLLASDTRRSQSVAIVSGDLLEPDARPIVDRVKLARSRVLGDQGVLIDRLGVESDWPGIDQAVRGLRGGVDAITPRFEARLLEGIQSRRRQPSVFAKAALWLILLWFPFLQPISAGLLALLAEGGSVQIARGLYHIVLAMSAAHLLAGFAVVAGIFLAILAAMYARSLKLVRKCRAELEETGVIENDLRAVLRYESVEPLMAPFRERLAQLDSIERRLIEGQMPSPIA